eukprot:238270_1
MPVSLVCTCGGTILRRKGQRNCPNFRICKGEECICIQCKSTVCGLLSMDCWDKFAHSIIWENHPFDAGMCRYAHKARKVEKRTHKTVKQMVVKQFKDKSSYNKSDWKGDIKCYDKAIELITEWNKLGLLNKKYIMHKPILAQITGWWDGDKYDEAKREQWVLIEEYLDGKYEKWNSNSGWCQNPAMSVQAFCHWTYHHSKGNLLFCDAQGVRGENNYFITDPAIMSAIAGQYGCTDLGVDGIKQWFQVHKCNQFCSKDWIRPNGGGNNSIKIQKASTYRWQTKAQ